MNLFLFLTVVQALIAAALVGAILMQRSEGGGLGIGGGGSPGGLMSARGAGDFMTRMTAILALLFVGLSISLAAVAVGASSDREIVDTLTAGAAESESPLEANPLEGASGGVLPGSPEALPASSGSNDNPLSGAAE